MIDTLHLRLNEVLLLPNADLEIDQGRISNRTGEIYETELCRDTSGVPLIGAKAFKNTDDFQLTVDPFGWKLQTSVPKLAGGGLNFLPVDGAKAKAELERLQGVLLDDVGIKTDILNSNVIRADLFRNGLMKYSPLFYFPIIEELPSGRRMQKRGYGETVLFLNKERETCFYDKILELSLKHGKEHAKEIAELPKNVLRAEIRMLRGRVVERQSCFGSATSSMKKLRLRSATDGHFQVSGLLERWNDLPEIYGRQIKEMVFHKRVNVPSMLAEIERLKLFKEKKRAWQKAKENFGLYYFASKYSQKEFEIIVREVFGRFVALRAVREFFQTKVSFGLFDLPEVKGDELYEEIYQKLVA